VKRRREALDGTVGPGRSSVGRRMQPPNAEFFTLLSEARSDSVERLAIPLAARAGSVPAAGAV
jgi:hypothetical protein